MQVTVVCDDSNVIAGVKETFGLIKSRCPAILDQIADDGTMEAIKFLEESFVRPDWTQSGRLVGAIFNSIGRFNKATWSSGVGNIRLLNAQAHYWEEIEKGTHKYITDKHKGFFVDESGVGWEPRGDMRRMHKWIEAGGGYDMEVKKPITAHNYFKKTSEFSRTNFPAKMINMMNEVFA